MVDIARQRGIPALEFNIQATDASPYFSETRSGPASETVVRWVNELV
jgi:hypothetical protein